MKLIGIDIGTSGLKISIYDEEVNVLKSDSTNYTVQSPLPGVVEIDPLIIWEAFKNSLHNLLKDKINSDSDYVMSFSVLGDALIVADEDYNPVVPSILSSDTRSAIYSKKISEQLNIKQLYFRTGRIPHNMSILNRLLWFQDCYTQIYEKAQWFLDYSSWFFAKLGFYPMTDYSSASGTLFFDIHKKCYDEEILKWAKIPKEKLPTLLPSGKLIGEMPEAQKKELGFPQKSKLSVVSGGMDQICNALGTGTVFPNHMVCSMGTVEATTTVLNENIDIDQLFFRNYYRSVSAIPEQFVTFSFLWTGGGSLRWYRDTLGPDGENIPEFNGDSLYKMLIGDEIKPSKEIFLPYLSGTGPPFWDSMARGVFLGLDLASVGQNFVDAILEGISFDLRYNLEQLQKAGIEVEKICVVGGGSRSSKWLQIKADIVKKPILRLKRQEGGSLGAALLAGHGIGLFRDLREISQKINKIDKVFYPSEKYAKIYEKKYELFKESYVRLKEINQKIYSILRV